jgi:hypothetical protein
MGKLNSRMVHAALRAWNQKVSQQMGLFDLKIFQSPETREIARKKASYSRLERLIEELGEHEPEHSRLLSDRFVAGQKIAYIAAKRHISVDQVNRLQRSAIESLTDLITHREAEVAESLREALLAQLPPRTYTTLIGRDALVNKTITMLNDPKGPSILELVGLGGLGKTAVAHAAAQKLIEADAITSLVWIRAEQTDRGQQILEKLSLALASTDEPTYQNPSQLARKLKRQHYLIVLDSLSDQLNEIDWLYRLAEASRPSRFLLTGRILPNELAPVFTIRVSEVAVAEANAIAEQQAATLGLKGSLTPELFELFYERTGGNPLAIKLVVGMLRSFPGTRVRSALQRATSTKTEDLFREIYSSCWETLDENSRSLLLSSLWFIEDGVNLEQLKAVAKLNERETNDATYALIRLSLLELRATSEKQKYGIHRLTRSFLQTRIDASPDIGLRHCEAAIRYWLNEVNNYGAKVLITTEERNLVLATERALLCGEPDLVAELLTRLYPGLGQTRNIDLWLKVHAEASRELPPAENRATLLFQSGSLWLQANQPGKAEGCFTEAIALTTSRHLSFMSQLGVALARYQQGDVRSARKLIAKASLRLPQKGKMLVAHILSTINYLEKEYPAADKKLATLLKERALLTPHTASRIHMKRALVQLSLRNPRQALKQLRLGTDALPASEEAGAELAQLELLRSYVLYKLRDLPNAEAALQRAKELSGEAGETAYRAFLETSLGRIHLANKKSAVAADFLGSASKLWKKLGQPTLAADAASLLLVATSGDSARS